MDGYRKAVLAGLHSSSAGDVVVQEVAMKPHTEGTSHSHESQTEIFYSLGSNGYFLVGGKKILMSKGDILVIEPGEQHTVGNDSDAAYLFLAIKLDRIPGSKK